MVLRRWPIGQCRVCLGWGELRQFADCVACSSWQHTHPERGTCRRCRHLAHVNSDRLCRLCMLAIRTEDPGWIVEQSPGGSCQLGLILPGVRLPSAQPLDRPLRGAPPDRGRPRPWLERLRVANDEPVDDDRVLPPAVAGQLVVVLPRRRLTDAHERRIRGRDLIGQDTTKAVALEFAAEAGFSKSMAYWLARMARLALAVRDADGCALVPHDALYDLPHFAEAVAEILRRAGMLGPRRVHHPPTVKDPALARGCVDCDCWGVHTHPRCSACQAWKFGPNRHPVGVCVRCGRTGSPIRDGHCRACCVHVEENGPDDTDRPATQLWFGGDLALKLRNAAGVLGYVVPRHRARRRAAARRPPPPPVSPHRVDPAQGVLFEARRDWSCIGIGELDRLPPLTPAAQAILNEFQRYARDRCWDEQIRRHAARSLHIVLAWVGADAPIREADLRSLPTDRPGTNARRVVQFLAERGLLVPDPDRRVDVHERAVEQKIQTLPDRIADELRRWVQVLRGEGRRPHPARSFETIRKYLGYVYPVLQAWAAEHASLREITPDHIDGTMQGLTGNPASDRITALRSLFRALKQERLVFRDPTRGITQASVKHLPAPIPTDRLRGLIDRAATPLAQLVVAFVAIHGLGNREVTRLLLADLDRARGTLVVHRPSRRHTVYLDELTHRLTAAWLRERHHRWPTTTNPHLLISQQTAEMDTRQPISAMVVNDIFRRVGVLPSALRQDRILDEARHTADPVHLMRVFGVAAETAVGYVYAAHPERRSTILR
jgi:site-specific recombinase XerD